MATEVVRQAPPEFPMRRVTERPINTSGPGPYYVYLPSLRIDDLMRMTHLFAYIPAGEVFPITSTKQWVRKGQLPDGAARDERIIQDFFGVVTDQHDSLEIPAETTKNALFSDRVLTQHGLIELTEFALLDVAHEGLNKLIKPVRFEDRDVPEQFRQILTNPDGGGMLALRRIWLQQALDGLRSGRVIEDVARLIDAQPYLRELWINAIEKVMIPAVDQYVVTANNTLASKEEAIRAGEKKVYDIYDNTLMWLLARKPERTALSRTLEGTAKGGIGIEEIRALVEGVVGANTAPQAAAAAVTDRMQCPDCGEFVNAIMGSGGAMPPRKCRHCDFEFRSAQPIQEVAASNGDADVPVPDNLEALADKIIADKKKRS